MKITEPFKGDENFWELNPQFKIILKDFYDKDKSVNKTKSSKIMWAFYFRDHPKSDFYYLNDKDITIARDWLKNPRFNWETDIDVEKRFMDSILTQGEKSFVAWNETMKKRDLFMHDQDFSLDAFDENGKLVKGTADQLDKMLANTSKLYQEYFKIKKELEQEEIKRGKGNKPKSLSDSGEI